MKVTYSAPAKIILSGEHSVVYTKPAFVSAVDYRLTVTLEDVSPASNHHKNDQAIAYINTIVVNFLHKSSHKSDIRPFHATVSSDIPEGKGMGSSAAYCVAFVAALFHFYTGDSADTQTISSLAYQSEKFFHGMPSGVDVSASCYGGLIFYRKEFEFLKTISALNFKIPKAFEDRIILIDTGKPIESTKEMVAHVGKRYNAHPKEMDQTLAAIERVTKRMVISIVKEDLSLFTDCIQDNQNLLEDLGIASPQSVKLIKSLQSYGCGKVTGAGGIKEGSGLVLFLITNTEIYAYLEKNNIPWFAFKPDLKGVYHQP